MDPTAGDLPSARLVPPNLNQAKAESGGRTASAESDLMRSWLSPCSCHNCCDPANGKLGAVRTAKRSFKSHEITDKITMFADEI